LWVKVIPVVIEALTGISIMDLLKHLPAVKAAVAKTESEEKKE